MAVKIFSKILMASEFDVNRLKDGYFQAAGVDAAVEDGAFVSIKDLRDHDLYNATNGATKPLKDGNARNIEAYDATYPIFGFVDYVGVSHGDILGVNYRIGDKLVGTAPSAGEGTRVRTLEVGDEFWLGDGNFTAAPVIGTDLYAVPAAGTTTLTGAASAPASGPYFAIEDERDLIMGAVNEGSKLIRCRFMGIA